MARRRKAFSGFQADDYCTGLVSNAVGGVDIGPYIGFVTAAGLYDATFRIWPDTFKIVLVK